MIPMSCPKCGSRGEIPLDRLNSRLKCRKCKTMFYMDETGSIVLGDPNDPKTKGRKKQRASDSGPAVDFDFDVRKMVQNIPKPVKVGVLALGIVLALGYGVTALVASIGTPADLKGRSAMVAEYFVDGKVDELEPLTTPETFEDMRKWHEVMRPKLNYEGARRNRRDVFTGGEIMSEETSTAWTFATLVVPGAAAAAAASTSTPDPDAPKNTLSLSLYWVKKDGQWLIDGARTYAEAIKPIPRGRGRGPITGGRR